MKKTAFLMIALGIFLLTGNGVLSGNDTAVPSNALAESAAIETSTTVPDESPHYDIDVDRNESVDPRKEIGIDYINSGKELIDVERPPDNADEKPGIDDSNDEDLADTEAVPENVIEEPEVISIEIEIDSSEAPDPCAADAPIRDGSCDPPERSGALADAIGNACTFDRQDRDCLLNVGSPNNDTVFLIGDSFSTATRESVRLWAQQSDLTLYHSKASGCGWIPGVSAHSTDFTSRNSCLQTQRIDRPTMINEIRPDVIILQHRNYDPYLADLITEDFIDLSIRGVNGRNLSTGLNPQQQTALLRDMQIDALNFYASNSREVIVIETPPTPLNSERPVDPCASRSNRYDPNPVDGSCDFPARDYATNQTSRAFAEAAPNVTFVEMSHLLCTNTCAAVDAQGNVVRSDRIHISPDFVQIRINDFVAILNSAELYG